MKALLLTLLALLAAPAHAQFGTGDSPVTTSAAASRAQVLPGGQFAIAVVLDHAEGYHSWPAKAQHALPPAIAEFAINTEIVPEPAAGLTFGPVQWPELHDSRVADPSGESATITLKTFSGKAVAYVPVVIGADVAPGARTITINLGYQSCDENSCLPPEDVALTVEFEILAPGATASAPTDADLFAGFDVTGYEKIRSGDLPTEAVEFNVFELRFSIDPSGVFGLILLQLVAALGGFVLNLTPCVLPVVPLKVMGLSQAAGNRARCFYLGVVMSVGVVAFFAAIGAAIALLAGFTAISSLFQTGWFAVAVGLVIAVMALGMFGLFTTGLPQWVYRITPKHDSTIGSFLWGVLTAVLSTPCTAPFMGAATAWATQQSPGVTMGTFSSIGLGMALPYLILSANPAWVRRVPRTGPGSELVKQVMGLLLLGVASFFIGTGLSPFVSEPNAPAFRGHWWVVAFFGVAACVWLIVRTFRITHRPMRRAIWTVLPTLFAAATIAVTVRVTDRGPIDWRYYSDALFAERIAAGDVVVLDFTAEWCLNCKALESSVLHTEGVASRLNGPGVTPIKVDLTGDNPEGKARLRELNWVGIPLLAVFGPGVDKPILLGDGYTVRGVLDAIDRAAGG